MRRLPHPESNGSRGVTNSTGEFCRPVSLSLTVSALYWLFFTHINTAQSHLANRASAPECRQDSTHILFRLPPLLTMVSILFHGFSTKCHFCAILSTDNPL